MCGRFTLRTPTPVLIKTFRIDNVGDVAMAMEPRFNVAPTQAVATIRDRRGQRELSMMRWGLVPFWAKDLSIGSRMINARSETLAEKPAFRAAFKKRRCLVVSDGYFEWKKSGKQKLPYWIRMEDHRPFAMAGLWESWRDKEAKNEQPIQSCTIITTDSNEATSELHDRMPVILDADDWDLWLDDSLEETKQLETLFRPYESDAMTLDAVSTFVNNARNEGPECVEIQKELF